MQQTIPTTPDPMKKLNRITREAARAFADRETAPVREAARRLLNSLTADLLNPLTPGLTRMATTTLRDVLK